MKMLSTQWFRFLALAMAATVYIGAPLMLLGDQPWAMPPLTALVVFPTAALAVLLIKVMQPTRAPRFVAVLVAAALVGAIVGLSLFPWGTFGQLGLVICVPLALIAAGMALIMEWVMIKVPPLALLAVIVGGSLLLSSLVGIITQAP